MLEQIQSAIENVVSPTPAMVTLGSTSVFNLVMDGLPLLINLTMFLYGVLCVIHKLRQMKKDESKK